jgi:hypothetical protein
LKKCDDDKQEGFLQSKLKLPDFWRHRSCLITLFLFNFFLIFLMCAMVDKYWGNAVSDQWPFCLTCERIILIRQVGQVLQFKLNFPQTCLYAIIFLNPFNFNLNSRNTQKLPSKECNMEFSLVTFLPLQV